MMSRWQSVFVLSCFCLGAVPAIPAPAAEPVAAADGYQLQFDFPRRLGETHRIEATAVCEERERCSVKGKEESSVSRAVSAELKGVQTIVALSQNQQASKVKIILESLKIQADYRPQPFLEAKAGDELVVERKDFQWNDGNEFLVTLNGRELTGIPARMVTLLVEVVPPSDRSSANRSYQPVGKKKPGDAWPVNSRAFIDNIILPFEPGIEVNDDQVKGTISFQGVVEEQGVRYIQTKIDIACTNIRPKAMKSKVVFNDTKAVGQAYIPLDKSNRNVIGRADIVRTFIVEEEVGAKTQRREQITTTHQTSRAIFIAPGK